MDRMVPEECAEEVTRLLPAGRLAVVEQSGHVNPIAPGAMDTGFFSPAETDDSVAYLKAQAMNGELTRIEYIAPWVKFPLTDGWWANGQVFFINGGFTAR
ncbi:hypothetical protein ACFYZB_26250 [Streptomyces sp. NPDC001852]|uniref:hypothetical protein n=1 Tax=Streptomyces sp. NPDC001852 TaxID=3364619 RepID=UPI00368D6ACE